MYYVYGHVTRPYGESDQSVHAAMVHRAGQEARSGGYITTLEDENTFQVEFEGVLISGRPDLVSLKHDFARVEDCKSGRRRQVGDFVQTMIYMLLLPRALPTFAGCAIAGVVHYQDGPIPISPHAVDTEFETRLRKRLRLLNSVSSDPLML